MGETPRITKFNISTQLFDSEFLLPTGLSLEPETVISPNSNAVTPQGRIYLGDGFGVGLIFKIDGEFLDQFAPPASTFEDGITSPSNSGINNFLQHDGAGNIFSYVNGSGFYLYHESAIPEPTACALIGLGLVLPIVRRRRTKSAASA